MRVAVSTDDNNGLDSVVSPHFGRCPFYVLVDLEGQQVRGVSTVANPYFDRHERGRVPAFIQEQGVNVMLTGGMGGRALGLFAQYGIEPVTGAYGTVRRALEAYVGGELQGAEPCGKSGRRHTDESAGDAYEQGELGRLREEAELLREQLSDVTARLDRLAGH
jgi:predicted Fe-Mo cluster-binding NifX family protein